MLKRSYIKCESAASWVEGGIKASRNGFRLLWLVRACSEPHNYVGVGLVEGTVKVRQALAGEDLNLQLLFTVDILLPALEADRGHCAATCLVGGPSVSEGWSCCLQHIDC